MRIQLNGFNDKSNPGRIPYGNWEGRTVEVLKNKDLNPYARTMIKYNGNISVIDIHNFKNIKEVTA